jgi:hypothetical protein
MGRLARTPLIKFPEDLLIRVRDALGGQNRLPFSAALKGFLGLPQDSDDDGEDTRLVPTSMERVAPIADYLISRRTELSFGDRSEADEPERFGRRVYELCWIASGAELRIDRRRRAIRERLRLTRIQLRSAGP